jgi:hypothetical protein
MINYWAARVCHFNFWIHLAVAISSPVFAYYGVTPKDMKTWCTLLDFLKDAISNPYVLSLIIINAINTCNNPTVTSAL